MKVKDAIKYLKQYDGERELVMHEWDKRNGVSRFYELMPSATPEANSKNMVVMIPMFIETKRICKK